MVQRKYSYKALIFFQVTLVPRSLVQLFCKRTETRQLAVSAVTMAPNEREDGKGREKEQWRTLELHEAIPTQGGAPRREEGQGWSPRS